MRSAATEREISDAMLLAIFRHAIRLGAVSVIVAHNHPSGDPTPSKEDIEETRRLVAAGELVGIPLDDHVVIGRDGVHTSIRGLEPERGFKPKSASAKRSRF